MSRPIHALASDTVTFCGPDIMDSAFDGSQTRIVTRAEWLAEPEQIQRVPCEDCLLRLYMLGDSARIALARMGRVVQVVDVTGEES